MHQVGQQLCEVFAYAVLAAFPGVNGEERHMFQVGGDVAFGLGCAFHQYETQHGAVEASGSREYSFIFLPVFGIDLDVGLHDGLRFAHRGNVIHSHSDAGGAALGGTCPEGDAVLFAFLD